MMAIAGYHLFMLVVLELIGQDVSDFLGENMTCNGPLRRNRRFCVKLRAYTKYGWNDSMCSNIVAVEKQLEFDYALVVPTILAALPFTVFVGIIVYMTIQNKCSKHGVGKGNEDDDEALDADKEGELIRTWTMGEKQTALHSLGEKGEVYRRKDPKKTKSVKETADKSDLPKLSALIG